MKSKQHILIIHFVNKALLFIIFNFHFSIFNAFSQADTIYHQFSYGGTNDDYARQIIATNDSGYIVVGSTASFGAGQSDVYVIKLDSNGHKQWSHTYGTPAIEVGNAIRQMYDSGYIIVGYTNQNTDYDVYLIKINSSGDLQWSKTIGGTDWDFGNGIELTSDSGFIICGQTYSNPSTSADVYIIKCNSTGAVIWEKHYGGTDYESSNAIIRDRYNSYIVVGETSSNPAQDTNFYALRIKPDGDTLWTKTYAGSKFDAAYGVDTTLDGNYVLIGTTYLHNPSDSFNTSKNILFLKIDASGNQMWSSLDGGQKDEEGRFVKQFSDGSLLTGGMTESFGGGGQDVFLEHWHPNGQRFEGPTIGGSQDDAGYSAAVGKDNRMMIVGITKSYGCGLNDVYLIRKDTLSFGSCELHPPLDTICDSPIVGINELTEQKFHLLVSPNPAHDYIKIELNPSVQSNSKNNFIRISDVAGKVIQSIEINSPIIIIKRNHIADGIYFVGLYTENKLFYTAKLILF